jgi:hypothetical protein
MMTHIERWADNSSASQFVSKTIRQWTIRQRQFVSEGIEKTVKFLASYGVKSIITQGWIKSVVSIIVELEELIIKTEKLLCLDVETSRLRLIENAKMAFFGVFDGKVTKSV